MCWPRSCDARCGNEDPHRDAVELALDARYTESSSEQIDVAIRLGQVQTSSPIATWPKWNAEGGMVLRSLCLQVKVTRCYRAGCAPKR